MRTYLQLVQRLWAECDLPAGSVPSTVVGLTAGTQARRLADWIADAWVHILEDHPDYTFRRRSTTFTTINQQGEYTQTQAGLSGDKCGRWILDSFRAYLTASGTATEYRLEPITYDEWRDGFLFGPNRTVYQQPKFVAEHPQTKGLVLGPIPISGYTVVGDYYLAATADRLTADADTPGLPERYDSLGIVWRAMLDEGGFEADSAKYQRAAQGWKVFIRQLQRELPTPCFNLGF